jgi:diguanylate cyclase (GGDEF)-like protein
MAQQADAGTQHVGLFLNPLAQRRVDFQAACGDQFDRLFVADSTEQAAHILSQEGVALLIIDLERFDLGIDLAALGGLITSRNGAPVVLVCPFDCANWLAEMMAFGPLDYLIGPAGDAELRMRVASRPDVRDPGQAGLDDLLALRSQMQRAVLDVDDQGELAARVSQALSTWPGVAHAAMFQMTESGEPALGAQYSPAALLPRADPLLQLALRHACPGLQAACTGEFICLDAPEKAGQPELAAALHAIGVEMALGVPIRARGPGAPLGALCLMFERRHRLSYDELSTLGDLAQLAGFGLRMEEMNRDAEQLLGRVTHLAITDALTGVANRGRGEALLEQEIKRAHRYKVPLTLIAFDIDHFKGINDRYGHPCGDAALRIVGETTIAALRSSDLMARSGGDEFQIIAAHTDAIDGLKMAEKIRLAISGTAFPGCDRLTISVSVAQLAEQETADALMLRASMALARAKRAGRNCVELAMQ